MATRRILVWLAACSFLCGVAAAQDAAPSLADLARQSRQQKQQKDAQAAATDATAKDVQSSKPAHVYTNDEIPEHSDPTPASHPAHEAVQPETETNVRNREAQAEQWKQRIHAQKSSIASLQAEIARVSGSVRYSSTNCYNCGQYNERQKQKQDQVESMKAQLEEQKKQLEDMQESARKQGFGSSVYDP